MSTRHKVSLGYKRDVAEQKPLSLNHGLQEDKSTLQSQMAAIRDRFPPVNGGHKTAMLTKAPHIQKVRVVSQAVVGQPPIHRVLIAGNAQAALDLRKKGILGRRGPNRTTTVRSPTGHSAPDHTPSKRPVAAERQAKTTYSPQSRYLPQCPSGQAGEASPTSFKKRGGKPKVRLTLLDVTSFLPKPKRSHTVDHSDSSQGAMLLGQSILPVCQRDVSLPDARLAPSRPSFVELRQMRNQIIRSNLQRTQAWTTRDLSDRADLSGLTNYCDQEKTSMIMTWLRAEDVGRGRTTLTPAESNRN